MHRDREHPGYRPFSPGEGVGDEAYMPGLRDSSI